MTINHAPNDSPGERECRWAIISLDGNFSWLGREEPTDEYMEGLRRATSAHMHPLWLVRVEGEYYSQEQLIVTLWRFINLEFGGAGTFEDAVVAFAARRNRVIADYAGGGGKGVFPQVVARRDPDRARSPHPQAP